MAQPDGGATASVLQWPSATASQGVAWALNKSNKTSMTTAGCKGIDRIKTLMQGEHAMEICVSISTAFACCVFPGLKLLLLTSILPAGLLLTASIHIISCRHYPLSIIFACIPD